MTQNDVDYLDSLLAEKHGMIISPPKSGSQEDAFLPWKKEHEQAEFTFHQDTVFYETNVTLTLRGTGFRQDNIELDPGYGSISDIRVFSTKNDDNLLLEIDTVSASNSLRIHLNRFVPRNEQIRLHYRYILPLSVNLMNSTRILPFSKVDSDHFFWVNRPEWIPLLPKVTNAESEKYGSEASKEWQVHVKKGFKAVYDGQLLKETHTDSVSSYYFVKRNYERQGNEEFLTIIPNLERSSGSGLRNVTVHGVPENSAATKFFLHQLSHIDKDHEIPENWYFWDHPFPISAGEHVFVPSYSLIDSTVYPDISNKKLFGLIAAGKNINLPPAKDYPSLLFTGWMNRLAYSETIPNDEAYLEVMRSKQKLRSEINYYMRSVFEPQNDSLSFYFDAHQTEKGFLALRYMKSQFEPAVWNAFFSEIKEQEYLNEEFLKRLLSEYSGEAMTKFWQTWFYEPGFPLIYTELSLFEDQADLEFRQIRSHSTLPVYDLKIPVRIEEVNGHKRDTVLHFSSQDTLFVFRDSVRDVLIDPEYIVPAYFHHKRDTAVIRHRLRAGNASELIPLLNANSIPGNDFQRERYQEILFSKQSEVFRPILITPFLNYGVVEDEVYEQASGWDGRSRALILQFARTDSSKSASTVITHLKNDEQLFVRMEAIISSVIRGTANPVIEISTLSGVESYRDIKNKTAVYLSAFLDPGQQKNILMTIWNSQNTTDDTRMQILKWFESGKNITIYERDLTNRFWESKHLGLKKRILELIAQKGDTDFRLAMKKDLLKIASHYWVNLFQEAESGSDIQNDQSRQ